MKKKEKIWEQAKEAAKSPNRVRSIMELAKEKLKNVDNKSFQDTGAINEIRTLISMLKAHLKGEYKSFSPKTLIWIIFALLYFVIPTDLIPDFLPALGFTDDISVLYFVYKQINTDVEKFLENHS